MTLSIRAATLADLPAIERVMRASMAVLGSAFYDPNQVASAPRSSCPTASSWNVCA
jgi:hypothetical protein